MMTVHAFIGGAALCFDGQCYPALMGAATPVGQFTMHQEYDAPDFVTVLSFHAPAGGVPLVIRPTEIGRDHLYAAAPDVRRTATAGCITVPPHVFDALLLTHAVKHASILRIHRGRPGAAMFQKTTARLARSVRSPFARW
jgi:hypothetical protein